MIPGSGLAELSRGRWCQFSGETVPYAAVYNQITACTIWDQETQQGLISRSCVSYIPGMGYWRRSGNRQRVPERSRRENLSVIC